MLDFALNLTLDDYAKFAGIASALAVSATFLLYIRKSIRLYLDGKFWKIGGIYRSRVLDVKTNRLVISDAVRISKSGKYLKIKSLSKEDKIYSYKIKLSYHSENAFIGNWERITEKHYFGTLMLKFDKNNCTLFGNSVGLDSHGDPNIIEWSFIKLSDNSNILYNNLSYIKFIISDYIRLKRSAIGINSISRPISDNENSRNQEFKKIINGKELSFSLNKSTPNPIYSGSSFDLIEFAINNIGVKGKSVLNIGCGAGHYVVELKEAGAQRIDFTELPQSMPVARDNIYKHIEDKYAHDYETTKPIYAYNSVPRDQFYDLILANCPFALARFNRKFKNSHYFNSFATSRTFLCNLIVNAENYLNFGGSLIFPTGTGSPMTLINHAIGVSGLQSRHAHEFKSPHSGHSYTILRLVRNSSIDEIFPITHQ